MHFFEFLLRNMWNSFYVGGPNRSQRMEAFKQILAESAVPVEIVILQEMLLGAQKTPMLSGPRRFLL